MVQGKFISGQSDLEEILQIRRKAGIVTSADEVCEPDDRECMHVIVYAPDQTAAAAGSIYFNGQECKVFKVAVLPEYQNCGYGDLAVRMMADRAFMSGAHKIKADVPQGREKFFEKIGFRTLSKKNESEKMVTMCLDQGMLHKCCDCKQ